jgi:isopentenyl phosphate kinase
MLTFIKLGGSLITDKTRAEAFRQDVMARLAQEIAAALAADPSLRLLIGHGSGSFGHFAAHQYGTIDGVLTVDQWRGFAEVANAAAELNYRVAAELRRVGVPVWRFQPSASALCRDGKLLELSLRPVQAALEHGLIPLLYGDVAIDEVRGGTIISTEAILDFVALRLPVKRLLLLGEVAGVYDPSGHVIPRITPGILPEIEMALRGSSGVDVTGGMDSKVRDMLALVSARPQIEIRILDGSIPDLLFQSLCGVADAGTVIAADS